MSAPILEPLGVLARAQDSFGVAAPSPTNEWPFNLLSQQAVKHVGGRIGRVDDPRPAADPDEQRLCDAVAEKATAMVNRMPVRPPEAVLEPFRVPTVPGERGATVLTLEVVRAAFGGTLHPWARVDICPLAEAHVYARAVSYFGVPPRDNAAHLSAWKTVIHGFKQNTRLIRGGWAVSVRGKGVLGPQEVRLLVGLTKAGSLAGVVPVGPAVELAAVSYLAAVHASVISRS